MNRKLSNIDLLLNKVREQINPKDNTNRKSIQTFSRSGSIRWETRQNLPLEIQSFAKVVKRALTTAAK
jgi:hypothetical protein